MDEGYRRSWVIFSLSLRLANNHGLLTVALRVPQKRLLGVSENEKKRVSNKITSMRQMTGIHLFRGYNFPPKIAICRVNCFPGWFGDDQRALHEKVGCLRDHFAFSKC